MRAALLGVALAASSLPLRATPPPPASELVYEVEPSLGSCPDAASFRRTIGRQLGFEPFASAASTKVVVRVRQAPGGIEGVVTWLGAHGTNGGERRFASALHDCKELAHAMQFAIIVEIELRGVASHPASPQPEEGPAHRERDAATRPPPSLPDPAVAAGIRAVAAPEPERAHAAPRVFVGVGPLIGWGTSPSASAGGRLFVSLRLDALSFELGTEASLPSVWRNEDGNGFRGRALVGTLAACGHLGALSLCGVGKAGALHVTGFGVDEAVSSAGWFVQLGARLAASHWFGEHWLGSVHGELLATPSRWTVELNRLAVWTLPSIAGLVGMEFSTPLL